MGEMNNLARRVQSDEAADGVTFVIDPEQSIEMAGLGPYFPDEPLNWPAPIPFEL